MFSIRAFVKLERMKLATKKNPFALRSRMYINAVQVALEELRSLRLAGAETWFVRKVSYGYTQKK